MWWSPATPQELELTNAIRRIRGLLSELRVSLPAYGVGSTWDSSGQRVLLLLVDRALDPRENLFALLRSIGYWLADPNSMPFRFLFAFPAGPLVPLRDVGRDIRLRLQPLNPPDDTMLFFGEPPIPCCPPPGTHIWAEQDGTVGFVVRTGAATMWSTAGHVVPYTPHPISVRRKTLFGLSYKSVKVGDAMFRHVPPEVDVALVASVPAQLVVTSPAQLADPPNLSMKSKVWLRGGRSSDQPGWIMAPLLAVYPKDGVEWENCWVVNGNAFGFARRGDSGGPVFLAGNPHMLIGHLVAVTCSVLSSGRYMTGIVQDINTIRTFLREKHGSHLQIELPKQRR
jgi:hypothetical protein